MLYLVSTVKKLGSEPAHFIDQTSVDLIKA